MKGILGQKVGMTQVFAENGRVVPVTVVKVEPNIVTQIKTVATDGYNAIQLGMIDKKKQRTNSPMTGHYKAAKTVAKKFTKEIRLNDTEIMNYQLGQQLNADFFEAGEVIDVQGTTKGKGFQGNIKRHNQKMGPNSHGSRYHRRPGSMGSIAPQVFKGKKLPGQMGGTTVTVQNLEIIMVDLENNLFLIKGNVPGAKNSYIIIKNNIKGHKNEVAAKLFYMK